MDYNPLIGVQGSVIGFDDPWHKERSAQIMRTGEGRPFLSQDRPGPSPEEMVSYIKALGLNLYLHHVVPDEEEILKFIESISTSGLYYLLGNEYGNINGAFHGLCNRYDVPHRCIEKAQQSKGFLGLVYDETEHLQLHPSMYTDYHAECKGNKYYQWADTSGLSLEESERSVAKAVRAHVEACRGASLYSEQVFPVMYHTFARGGMNPCPKLLKEEFQSVQLATALGACRQYNRKLSICVDLWGQDVGAWFTRVWGFPGHSPREFQSALELAYLMSPDMMYVENIDILAHFKDSRFNQTEFGDVLERFVKDFVPAHRLTYSHRDARPDIALVRSDDSAWGMDDCLYGNTELSVTPSSASAFHVFHALSHGTIPINGITFFAPQFSSHAGHYVRNEHTLAALPLPDGVGRDRETKTHTLFHPLNNVIVFDEQAGERELAGVKLIVLAGSRMSARCLKAVERCVRDGATCIAFDWLLPPELSKSRRDGNGQWIVTNDLEQAVIRETITRFTGFPNVWRQVFSDTELCIENPSGDGISLEFTVIKE